MKLNRGRNAGGNKESLPRAMSCLIRVLLPIVLLLVTAHRLPAPITEVPESPTPAPTVAPIAKPKSKPLRKPKQTAEPKSKPERNSATSTQPTPPKTGPYTGTWAGTISISMVGDTGYTFLVDSPQTTVKMWGSKSSSEISKLKPDICPASIGADGISWSWSMWKWTLKPYPDGKTALVRVVGPFQNASAVFEREK